MILQNPDDVALFEDTRLVDPAQVVLIPGSGVDCMRFVASAQPRNAGPMRVLLAARLLWDKGIAEYIVAAQRLQAEGRAIWFLLAGDPDPGNPAAVAESKIRDWADVGIIEWLGHA